MCRSLDHKNFRRCKPDDRSRAMAAARRRILRYNKELQVSKGRGILTEEREKTILTRIIEARADLEYSKKLPKGTNYK